MNFFQRMYRNGLGENEDSLAELRTSITNLIVIFTLPYVISYLPTLNKLGHSSMIYFYVTLCLIMAYSYYLNYQRKNNLATIIVFLVSSLLVVTPILAYGRDTELQALFPIMIVFVFVLFDKTSELIAFSIYIILLYLISFYVLDINGALIQERVYEYDYYLNMGFAIFSCGFLAYIMMKTLKNYNDEQDEAFRKVEDQNRIIKKQNEEMELFTMMASHDLKTPTRTMISFLGLLDRSGEIKNPVNREYLDMAMSGASQLNNLILGISDFKNIGTEKTNISYEATDDIITKVRNTLGLSSKKPISIQGENLHNIKVASTELYHIFQNLLENSIKYNESEKIIINIDSKLTETEIVFTIGDNGIGIEEKFLEYIFHPFKKLHDTSQYDSTGLGLAICKKIVNNYNGTIRAESRGKGKGTKIILIFPIELLKK